MYILYIYKSETITISYVTFCISYWKFGNNRLINCLFGESAQHLNACDVHKNKYLTNIASMMCNCLLTLSMPFITISIAKIPEKQLIVGFTLLNLTVAI